MKKTEDNNYFFTWLDDLTQESVNKNLYISKDGHTIKVGFDFT